MKKSSKTNHASKPKAPKAPKIEMVPATRAEAAEYLRDVSAARVLQLETFIGNTKTTGIIDYTAAEALLKGSESVQA